MNNRVIKFFQQFIAGKILSPNDISTGNREKRLRWIEEEERRKKKEREHEHDHDDHHHHDHDHDHDHHSPSC